MATPIASPPAPGIAPPSGGSFFGHPRGLSTLFFTEMWERASYYGMRALLILYMTAAASGANPGMGMDVATAGAIYGLYTGLVYLLALPGGWVADNLWGQRKAVFVGGCIIAAGHFSLAVPTDVTFYLGLILIVCGTGLLKPNVSTVVGELYPEGGARRDAGFSLFYMGINIGAFFGPLVTSFLGEGYNWHWGFSVAGFGMVLGLIQYKRGERHLAEAGLLASGASAAAVTERSRRFFGGFFALVATSALFGWLVARGTIPLTLPQIAGGLATAILIIAVLYFRLSDRLRRAHRRGEEAAGGDLLALPAGGVLLVRLRAGGIVAQPVRGRSSRTAPSSAGRCRPASSSR